MKKEANNTIYILIVTIVFLSLTSCKKKAEQTKDVEQTKEVVNNKYGEDSLIYEQEKHFKNIRQLTFGGDNAEAYWSFDDKMLVFQSNNRNWGVECDQIFTMDPWADKVELKAPMVSTGKGRTTCSYYFPDNQTIVYASTHEGGDACPPPPPPNAGHYVWPIYADFDIYITRDGGQTTEKLISGPGYDAEATVSPKGDKIVFTSTRSGDLELYTANLDGSEITQITDELGYDGGAFFSPDGSKIIFRASRPKTDEAVKTYKDLLARGLVQPTEMELFMCNADGSDLKQITDLGNANWAPFFHPGGEKVIFSSNHKSKRGFPFNLFMINTDGSGLEQITYDDAFDSFAMFSNDGKHIVFASNRNNGDTRDTNIFVADWVE